MPILFFVVRNPLIKFGGTGMRRIFFPTLLFLLATSASAMAVELISVDGFKPDVRGFIGYAPDRIVVYFDSQTRGGLNKAAMAQGRTGIAALDRVGMRHGVASLRPQFPGARKKTWKGKEIDLAGWHKVYFSGNADVLSVVEEYKAIPGVVDAQPVSIHMVSQTPLTANDKFYNESPYQWHLPKIKAPEAWGGNQNGNPDIVVAVLDTGVKYFDPDLGGPGGSYSNPAGAEGNMWINRVEKDGTTGIDDDRNGYIDDWIGYDFVESTNLPGYPPCMTDPWWPGPLFSFLAREDCETADNDPRDFHGHGTHVSGIVGALTNNLYGVAAPAGGWIDLALPESGWDKGVRIMPLRIGWSVLLYGALEAGVVAMDYAAEALYYAAEKKANLANCSWESENTGGLGNAIDYFLASGGLIFKAAGNSGGYDNEQTADFMSGLLETTGLEEYRNIISVAATDQNDCKASFSSYGTWVDISAPGVRILSLFNNHLDPAGGYVTELDGTSMAAPLAASVAALIWSKNPELPAWQVRQILFDTADAIDGSDAPCNYPTYAGKLGAGRVNAYSAVSSVSPPACNDADHDGYFAETGCGTVPDCDDNNDAVYPNAPENCYDNQDNDCDGWIDSEDLDSCPATTCTDDDHDGYAIEGGDCGPVDCNDSRFEINPGEYDICNNAVDEDCDGYDRKGKGCTGGGGNGGTKEICNNGIDDDGDGKVDCSDRKDCGKHPDCL